MSMILISMIIMVFVSINLCSATPIPLQFKVKQLNTGWEAAIQSNTGSQPTFATYLRNSIWPIATFDYLITMNSTTGLATFKAKQQGATSSLFDLNAIIPNNIGYGPSDLTLQARDYFTDQSVEVDINSGINNGPISIDTTVSGSPGDINKPLDVPNIFNISIAGTFRFVDTTSSGSTEYLSWRIYNSKNSPVPLPGAVLLLGAGMARLAAYARRRREQ